VYVKCPKIGYDKGANSQQKRKISDVGLQNGTAGKKDDSVFDIQNDDDFSHAAVSPGQPPSKKRRGDVEEKREVGKKGKELETSKPSALFTPREGRKWTVSMAVPGSIIAK